MLNLKSELFQKQKEVNELRSQNSHLKTSAVKASVNSNNKKFSSWLKKNSGVAERNKKDLLEVVEEDKHAKVKAILEAKSKLYEKMTNGKIIPDSEDSQVFLVDFEQKSIDAWREQSEKEKVTTKPETSVKMTSEVRKTIDSAREEWVEYKDSLGRTRTCLKEDLAHFQKQDERLKSNETQQERTLMSDDMRREEERLKWEKSALNDLQDELHYENLRFGEIRELGVGYYAFSGRQEERDEQMKRLNQLRKDTEKRKQENEIKKQKQQTLLTARLEKVRQRRIKQLKVQGKEIPESLLQPVQLPSPPTEKKSLEQSAEVKLPDELENSIAATPSKTREWDKGKVEWVPAKPSAPPRSWKDPRKERPSEFAPPEFYFSNQKRKSENEEAQIPCKQGKQVETSSVSCESDNNDRIQRLIAEVTSASASGEKTLNLVDQNITEASVVTTTSMPEPYIPSSTPISMKVISKPTKLLNTKLAFDS